MIKSVRGKLTKGIQEGTLTKGFPADLLAAAQRKLFLIDTAGDINDLRVPPGNRLEKLSGDMDGIYSIRINDQWRIIFRWEGGNAHEVQIIDYH